MFFDIASRCARGEIVALAGLVGAGRSEVARAIFGIDRAGRRPRRGGRPAPAAAAGRGAAMRAGIGFVPEDRRQQGLVMDLSIARNATLTRLRALAPPRADPAGAENAARARLGARGCSSSTTGSSDPVGTLSGGNQQKVVLGQVAGDRARSC